MAAVGKCNLCGESLSYTPEEISPFGRHLLEKHSEHITQFEFPDIKKSNECKCTCTCNKQHKGEKSNKRKYKTTVESWRQGSVEQECPNCRKIGLPLIRKQRNKVARSSLGTMCLVGCWPLCFLPFLIGGSDMLCLFCQDCGYFLGTYNRKTGEIQEPTQVEKNEIEGKV